MVRIRQKFYAPRLEHPWEAVAKSLRALPLPDLSGKRVGITVGSRRIANLPNILQAVGLVLKEKGAAPFLIPAMGSHGGGTAEGQTEMLRRLGITEESTGLPIVSSMEVQEVGCLRDGMPLYGSVTAMKADYVIVCGRIKPHTSIRGPYESGLVKMMTVGLGKHKGAAAFHQRGYHRLADTLEEAGPVLLQAYPVLCAIGIVENAYDETMIAEVIPTERILEREKELLLIARDSMPRFLVDDIDVLVVERIGKDISGGGMDPNITGRSITPLPIVPKVPVGLITVLSLTEAAHGNATGLGGADITTIKVAEQIDWGATYTNGFTSGALAAVKLPALVNSDREAIAMAICCVPKPSFEQVKVVYIQDTLHLNEILVSDPYLPQLKEREDIEILEEGLRFVFDEEGSIHSAF